MIKEVDLSDDVLESLIAFSEGWAAEGSCWGYRPNTYDDITENRIFLSIEDNLPVGYLFGKVKHSGNMKSIMAEGTPYFEVEELYVKPAYRSRGIGKALFEYTENAVRSEAEYMVLSTATKNWKTIFHFYIDEIGMNFWSARLFKRIEQKE